MEFEENVISYLPGSSSNQDKRQQQRSTFPTKKTLDGTRQNKIYTLSSSPSSSKANQVSISSNSSVGMSLNSQKTPSRPVRVVESAENPSSFMPTLESKIDSSQADDAFDDDVGSEEDDSSSSHEEEEES